MAKENLASADNAERIKSHHAKKHLESTGMLIPAGSMRVIMVAGHGQCHSPFPASWQRQLGPPTQVLAA